MRARKACESLKRNRVVEQQSLTKLLQEMRDACVGLEEPQAVGVRYLQGTVIDLLEEEQLPAEYDAKEQDAGAASARVDEASAEVPPSTVDVGVGGGSSCEKQHAGAGMSAVLGRRKGVLAFSADELLWCELGQSAPSLRIPIQQVHSVTVK